MEIAAVAEVGSNIKITIMVETTICELLSAIYKYHIVNVVGTK